MVVSKMDIAHWD